jgi:cytochrome b pre-mRNA-processing protein 3
MNKNYINIYNNLIKFSRNKKLFSIFTKEDSFSDRLIIFLLHFGFFLKIYKNNENQQKMQNIYDYIFKQLELSIREIGYGDVTINKKMKTYINTFHSLLNKIEIWEDLTEVNRDDLLRSFFNYEGEIKDLSKYFEKYRLFLIKSSLNLFTKGVVKLDF